MKTEPTQSFLAGKSLRDLGYALRHPETWPPGFEWEFLDCNKCAMGLAYQLGMATKPWGPAMVKAFGIPEREAVKIFCTGYLCQQFGVITAVDVANRIDAYLARQEMAR